MGSLGDLFVSVYVAGMDAFSSSMNTVADMMTQAGNAAAGMLGRLSRAGGVLGNLSNAMLGLGRAGVGLGNLTVALGRLAVSLASLVPTAPFSRLAASLRPVFGTIADAARFAWHQIGSSAHVLAGDIARYFRPLIASAKDTFDTIKLGALMAWGYMGRQFASLFSGRVGTYLRVLAGVARTSFNAIAAQAATAWPRIAAALGPVATAIGTTLGGVVQSVQGFATASLAAIRNMANATSAAVQAMYMNFIPIVGFVFNGVRSTIGGFVGFVRSTFSTVGSLMLSPFRRLRDFVFSVKGAIAALGVSLSAISIGKYLTEVTADAEEARIAFTGMLGSQAKAVQMLKDIKQLADVTPLELPEVRDSARSLLAYGFAAKDVVERLRMLGDVAQGTRVPLQDVAMIYGKAREGNRIQGHEFVQFARRGLPVVSELAKMLGKTPQEVRRLGSEGAITFAHLDEAFRRLTKKGGIFHGLMEDMGKSITGRFSTLKDAVRSVGMELGGGLAPILKSTIDVAIKLIGQAQVKLEVWRDRIAQWSARVSTKLGEFGERIAKGFEVAMPYIVEFVQMAVSVKTAIGEITAELGSMVVEWVGGTGAFAGGVMDLMKNVRMLATNWDVVGKLAMAYIRNWARAGAAFATELPRQIGRNFSQLFTNLLPALKTFGELLKEVFLGAIKAAKRELPWYMGGGGAEDKSAINRIQNLSKVFANELGDAFDNTDDPADQSQAAIDRRARRSKLGQGALPGFDFGAMFSAEIPEIKELIDKLKELRGDQDKADAIGEAMNRMFEEKRKAEAAMKADLGGSAQAAAGGAGGGRGRNSFQALDPVAYSRALQASALSAAERSTERFQGNLLNRVDRLITAVEGGEKPWGITNVARLG